MSEMAEILSLRRERNAWRKLAEARAELLACYRTGVGPGSRKADSALTKIRDAKDELLALGVATP